MRATEGRRRRGASGARPVAAVVATAAVLAALMLEGAPARADRELLSTPPSRASAPPGEAPVQLDRLLQLPTDFETETPAPTAPKRREWRRRFGTLQKELEEENAALDAAQEKLAKTASQADAWNVGPAIPGVAPSTEGSVDYRLRREIRERKEKVRRLEREMRELEVEADLRGIPEEWRSAAEAP